MHLEALSLSLLQLLLRLRQHEEEEEKKMHILKKRFIISFLSLSGKSKTL